MKTIGRIGITWPAGQPEKARAWRTHRGRQWWEFILGWTLVVPFTRQVRSAWWYAPENGTAAEIAKAAEVGWP